MLKKSIPQHKRMAMGGGHTPLGYARGGMVSPMPAPARPTPSMSSMPARPGGMMSRPGAADVASPKLGMARPGAADVAPMGRAPVRSAPIRPTPGGLATGGPDISTVGRPAGPVGSKVPSTVGPMTTGGSKVPTMAMKTGGAVKTGTKVSAGVSAGASKNPLRTARANNGVVGMKDGGKAGKKC